MGARHSQRLSFGEASNCLWEEAVLSWREALTQVRALGRWSARDFQSQVGGPCHGKELEAGGSCPCSLQGSGSRCPFRIPSSSNDLMILCHILVGRTGTAMDTRNKHYGMRAGQLQQAAAAATNILTRERRQGSQRAPGRPPVPLGTPPCPAARGPAGEEQGGCETSL